MRVCPECGHHDPWYWRGSATAVGVEFCRLSDFQEDYQELSKLLIDAKKEYGTKNFVFDEHYCYHLTKGLRVERQSLIENPQPNKFWHIPVEKSPNKPNVAFGVNPRHHGKKIPRIYNPHPFQKKLLEGNK